MRSCYLIFHSIEHVQRRRTQLPCQLHICEMREFRSPGTALRNKGRTYLRQGMPGCPITPIRCRSSLRWWDVGSTYATVSESEVICDFRCGLKAKGNAPAGFRFEGVRNTPIWSPPVTSLASGEALPTLRRAARHYLGLESRFGAMALVSQLLEICGSRLNWSAANRPERQARGGLHGSWRGAGVGL